MFMLTAPVPNRRTAFVRLHTAAGFNLSVTPNHYLFSLPATTELAAVPSSLNAWGYTLPTKVGGEPYQQRQS